MEKRRPKKWLFMEKNKEIAGVCEDNVRDRVK